MVLFQRLTKPYLYYFNFSEKYYNKSKLEIEKIKNSKEAEMLRNLNTTPTFQKKKIKEFVK